MAHHSGLLLRVAQLDLYTYKVISRIYHLLIWDQSIYVKKQGHINCIIKVTKTTNAEQLQCEQLDVTDNSQSVSTSGD